MKCVTVVRQLESHKPTVCFVKTAFDNVDNNNNAESFLYSEAKNYIEHIKETFVEFQDAYFNIQIHDV